MRPKFITDEIIAADMKKNGWIEGCTDEHAREKVLEHYDATLSSDWTGAHIYIYEDCTRDGYTVYVITTDPNRLSVCDDIHYYDNDIAGCLKEAIEDGGSIMCETEEWIEEAIGECYSELLETIWEETRKELLLEGYVEKITNPINALAFIEMVSQDEELNKDSDFYKGEVIMKAGYDPKWPKHLEQIWQDQERYSIVANHYGLVINAISKEEIVFSEVTPK